MPTDQQRARARSARLLKELEKEVLNAMRLGESIGILIPAPLALGIALDKLSQKYPLLIQSQEALGGALLSGFDEESIMELSDVGDAFIRGKKTVPKKKKPRKLSDYNKRMKRALEEVNKSARLKNGSFRKGWDQTKVMKKAHKLARKYGPSTKKGQVRKTARRAYRK